MLRARDARKFLFSTARTCVFEMLHEMMKCNDNRSMIAYAYDEKKNSTTN